ncbi:MAG: exonuclease SbcCD subunit D [Chloroflexi bacterium]|nr:MAG: exonuclease SbcCD subunit D [Chloroflexota bacterium]MBL1195639.1 exonuclease SbcCD subunit D [Chloroflexota bacterium]NOH12927.1 exonuclease SbcCD subunit D [Chloroflexota bacterium]
MIKLLHFADAHIDMANYGRHDPDSGLPVRAMDYLKSLDTIVEAAIEEKVDLVVFAGDAYKDRNPAPTYQREWDKRMMQLSRAEIPNIVLVGNHDMSPSHQRAHALTELKTLEVPYIYVIDEPTLMGPDELDGLQIQVLALPWITRSGMVAYLDMDMSDPGKIYTELESKVSGLIDGWMEEIDANLPTVFTAHATIQGAKYGAERTVMLGGDLVLSPALVKDKRLDYVALGHIHKPQNLNEGEQPPIIYPGSIERIDFGEEEDKKFYMIVELEKGEDTQFEWHELKDIRPFKTIRHTIESDQDVTKAILAKMTPPDDMAGAVIRLILEYPREWESLIDEAALRETAAQAFEFHLVKRPQMEARVRLPEDKAVGAYSHEELLEHYWKSAHVEEDQRQPLMDIAKEVMNSLNEDKG